MPGTLVGSSNEIPVGEAWRELADGVPGSMQGWAWPLSMWSPVWMEANEAGGIGI